MNASRHGTSLRGLLLLNAAMLAVLAVVTFAPNADAQNRARGDYTMVSGPVPAMSGSAVYIVDTINQEMMVIAFSQSSKRLEGIGYRNLAQDADSLGRGQQQSR